MGLSFLVGRGFLFRRSRCCVGFVLYFLLVDLMMDGMGGWVWMDGGMDGWIHSTYSMEAVRPYSKCQYIKP